MMASLEAFHYQVISDIRFVLNIKNMGDTMTREVNQSALINNLNDGHITVEPEHCKPYSINQ